MLAACGGVLLPSMATSAFAPGTLPRQAIDIGAAWPIRRGRGGLSIVQIGDSHTAADLFTGAVRQVLQERHGRGGIGYLPPGKPRPGVASTQVTITASAGWTYDDIQRSAAPDTFTLSGYKAVAHAEGETLSFTGAQRIVYTAIEIEVRTGPDAGTLAVDLDGATVLTASLAADAAAHRIVRIDPPGGRPGAFGKLIVRTTSARPVTISGIGISRADAGVTYDSVGFPGATVDILNRFAPRALAASLDRLRPDMIVLAFGTNEGFDDDLDPGAYRERYAAALRTIRASAPQARLVMIGPPQGSRLIAGCKAPQGTGGCATAPTPSPAGGEAAPARASCGRQAPPQLDTVRRLQRDVARQAGIAFWDWAALMPHPCGPERWRAADPPLMAKDHVHFTKDGYMQSGRSFANFLEPLVLELMRGSHAISND